MNFFNKTFNNLSEIVAMLIGSSLELKDLALTKSKMKAFYQTRFAPIWAVYEGHVCYLKMIAEEFRRDALMMQLISIVEVVEDPAALIQDEPPM